MAFCTQCGANLPEGARFCPGCGAPGATSQAPTAAPDLAKAPPRTDQPHPAPPPPPGPTGYPPAEAPKAGKAGLILPIVVIVAIVVIALMMVFQRGDGDGASTVTTDSPGGMERIDDGNALPDRSLGRTVVSAAALDAAFYDDRRRAADIYAGPVTVTGVIATMVTPGPTPALSLEGRTRFNYVILNFPVGSRLALADLYKGQTITAVCNSATSLGGTTFLRGCRL